MKFGSVKFFKRIIVGFLVMLILVPLVLAVVFGILYGRQKQRANWLESLNWALLHSEEIPEQLRSTQEVLQYMQNPPADIRIGPSFEYQRAYPQLYATPPVFIPTEDKVCYLTFDDGPSAVTLQILNTLSEYKVQATFFVTGENSRENPEALRRAAAAGHTVAVHTYSHKYDEIYSSVEAYLSDFEKMHSSIKEITGISPGVFRFAGGSINAYNQALYRQIVAEMLRRGFIFYDWNAAGNDAVVGGASRRDIVDNVLQSAQGRQRVVVLLHDRQDNTATAAALPEIIEGLLAQGYRFEPISPHVPPITFFYQEE